MSVSHLKEVLKEKGIFFGMKETLKNLKTGKIKEVFLSSNCSEKAVEDIEYYASLSKVKVIKLNQTSKDLGLVCKKNFSINVISH